LQFKDLTYTLHVNNSAVSLLTYLDLNHTKDPASTRHSFFRLGVSKFLKVIEMNKRHFLVALCEGAVFFL
jgi:hypothetical protein